MEAPRGVGSGSGGSRTEALVRAGRPRGRRCLPDSISGIYPAERTAYCPVVGPTLPNADSRTIASSRFPKARGKAAVRNETVSRSGSAEEEDPSGTPEERAGI